MDEKNTLTIDEVRDKSIKWILEEQTKLLKEIIILLISMNDNIRG